MAGDAKSNSALYGGVGQDKADHEPVTVYDKAHGAYQDQWAAHGDPNIGPSTKSKLDPTPFTLGK